MGLPDESGGGGVGTVGRNPGGSGGCGVGRPAELPEFQEMTWGKTLRILDSGGRWKCHPSARLPPA